MLLTLLLAVAGAAEPAAPQPTPLQPTPTQLAMHRALSAVHGAPDCAQVEALSDRPVEDLLFIAEHARAPAWVPMDAASCLVKRHAAVVEPALTAWMADPARRGQAELVALALPTLEPALAARLARAGLAGPAEVEVRRALLASDAPALEALARP